MDPNAAALLAVLNPATKAITESGQVRKDWKDARGTDKQAAARWLRNVRDCLIDLRKSVESGRPPTSSTSQLNTYAARMPKTVNRLLSKRVASTLQKRLREVHRQVKQTADFPAGLAAPKKATLLAQLDAAAGELKALADFAEAN